MSENPGEVTRLLHGWRQGEEGALDDLLPMVYDELRRLAASYMRRERQGHTLQTTALVSEAYMRLVGNAPIALADRSHFLAIAAQTMRRVLVDHARRQSAGHRIGHADKVELAEVHESASGLDADVLAVHQAIEDLSQIQPRQAKLVELRYFGGLTTEEIAEVLGVSVPTVARDWRVARLWLHRRLADT